MQHCNKSFYAGEQYCSECGETLTDPPSLKNIVDLHPDTAAQLKVHYPDTQIITGRVTASYFYRRNQSSTARNFDKDYSYTAKSDLSYSFWWLEITDKDNQTHHFNVDAESEIFQNLTKGDTLTAVFLGELTLTDAVVGDDAKAKVANHRKASACVLHDDGEQQSIIDAHYLPEEKTAATWAASTLILSWIMAWIISGSAFFAILPAIILCLGVYAAERRVQKRQFQEDEKHFAVLKAAIKTFINTSKKQLGYHLASRPRQPSDIFCAACNARIGADNHFCPFCGCEQQSEATHNNNVLALQESLFSRYRLEYQEDYEHKNILAFNNRGKVSVSCFLAKVLARDTEVKVKDVTNVKSNTQLYDVYQKDRFGNKTLLGPKVEGRTKTERIRTSNISGQLIVQLSNGEIVEQVFPKDMVSDLDVGDWFILAQSQAQLSSQSDYREFAYNVSKDNTYSSHSFQEYEESKTKGRWAGLLVLFIGLNIGFADAIRQPLVTLFNRPSLIQSLDYWHITTNLPILAFIVLSMIWWLRALRFRKQNRRHRQALLSRLTTLLAEFKAELPNLKDNIRRLS